MRRISPNPRSDSRLELEAVHLPSKIVRKYSFRTSAGLEQIVWGMPSQEIAALTEEYIARTAEAAGFPPGTTRLNPIPEVGQESPAGTRLSSDEIRQYLSGEVFEGTSAAGLRFVVEYSNDGSLSGKADSLADTGTWTVRADRLCRQWRRWYDGEMDCLVVLRDGETLRVYDSKGQAMGSGLLPQKAIAPRNQIAVSR